MKTTFIKYIFFLVVIILVVIAVYILYFDKKIERETKTDYKQSVEIVGTMNIGISNFDTINPILSKSKDVQYIDKLIFDSLVDIGADFRLEKSLAEEWSKLDDTTYLIKLKENKYWHDGELFTAKDVKFTIDNLKKLDSVYQENVIGINEVEILDDYTIKLHLNEPVPNFPYMLSFPILSMKNYEEGTMRSKTENPVGTGKYKIAAIEEKEIILESLGNAKIEEINIKIYENPMDLYNNAVRENIDFLYTNNVIYERYIGEIGFNKNIAEDRDFDYIVINNNRKILSNNAVRQAINEAIDRENIISHVYKKNYLKSDFPLDYGSHLYGGEKQKENKKYSYADKAKEILIGDGWSYENNNWKKSGVTNKLNFNLVVKEDESDKVLACENIKEQLGKMGIGIEVIKVSNSNYEWYLKNKNYDLILATKRESLLPNLQFYFGEGNLSNYYNEEMIGLAEEVKWIQNETVLKEKYERIAEIYKRDIPFISLYFNSNIIITSSKVKGNLEHNWYNLFYHIDNWYKVKE